MVRWASAYLIGFARVATLLLVWSFLSSSTAAWAAGAPGQACCEETLFAAAMVAHEDGCLPASDCTTDHVSEVDDDSCPDHPPCDPDHCCHAHVVSVIAILPGAFLLPTYAVDTAARSAAQSPGSMIASTLIIPPQR